MTTLDPRTGLSHIENNAAYDVIVLGAGAGGMSAALFAAIRGQRVLLLERTPWVGGTTALSGGTTWVPLTRYLGDTDLEDSYEKVMNFLDHAVGNHSHRELRESFVRHGAEAIHTLVDHTEVAFRACAYHPDYMADLPNASLYGRALEPLPYIADRLGKARHLLRHPIPEFTVLGGMMVNREDIGHLLKRFDNAKSFFYSAKVLTQYALDKVLYGRTRRSVMGHALIARMLQSLVDKKVDILVETEVIDITSNSDSDWQLTLQQKETQKTVHAKRALILASGGFSRNPEKRHQFMPHTLPTESPSAEGHSSNLHSLVEAMGAHYGTEHDQPAFWAPVSLRQRKDGSKAVFPHFVFDRSKPGTLCVNLEGKRFVNETVSYHEFGKAMLNGGASTEKAWIITDSVGLQKYGLGMVRLGGDNPEPYIRDGYLKHGDTLEDLAHSIQVDPNTLASSVQSINDATEAGYDALFGRGSNAYQRANGDPEHAPNPTLGKIAVPPFYAVKLQPADIGAAQGLVGNENGQLLTQEGNPIPKLYACGNDLQSIMGGTYPGPGITIGPAIVFAYLAIRHAALNDSETTLTTKRPSSLAEAL
ncbi:FAD-dependent oxidoreductase [Marinomonas ostreistagni]|uniref:FAD-dependent oxidoreductase n=1 Tax=Marinomonas ostreistagni TaxID=359209 RepID=A0ABS0Z9F6_9GAMM|nr:FAD-dependent oxidoreductase [Marinomonas ostreistagni]MBJ7550287.1 FAD-dependent oxidoreductase [Marinomonas ostreistagni]